MKRNAGNSRSSLPERYKYIHTCLQSTIYKYTIKQSYTYNKEQLQQHKQKAFTINQKNDLIQETKSLYDASFASKDT